MSDKSEMTNDQWQDDDLVAYLDGELAADHADAIEKSLRHDKELRTRLSQLQSTWDMLDSLPRAEAKHSFTQSTLELVVDDARREIRKNRKGIPAWPIYSLISMITIGIGCLIGFLIIDSYQKKPIREMVADLPSIENVDQYLTLRDDDTFEVQADLKFLKMLQEEGDLFADPENLDLEALDEDESASENAGEPKNPDVMTYREGIEYIESLGDKQLLELKQKQRRFARLSEKEKEYVRKMHEAIENDPQRTELRYTLNRYHDWIKTLKSRSRANLMELEPAKRIETIRFLQAQQHYRTFGIEDEFQIPNVDDTSVVYKWLGETINLGTQDEKGKQAATRRRARSRAQLLENILDDENVARELFFTDEQVAILIQRLSPESQYILTEIANNENSRYRLVTQWCRAVAAFRVTSAQREAMYSQLSPEDKNSVDEMSIEMRRRYLDRKYWRLKRN